MERRTPLRRTGPIKRSSIKSNGKKRRTGVPVALREDVMLRDGGCVAAHVVRSVTCSGRLDPHHVLRRSQGGPDSEDNLITLCRTHHDWVHANPQRSYDLGFLRRREPGRDTL